MRVSVVVLLVSAIAAGASAGGARQPPHRPLPDLGVPDARLTSLFTPAAGRGAYEVYRSTRPIAALTAELRALDPAPRADAWKLVPIGPGDAFGSSAPYDAAKLARLYVAARPLVARGSLRTGEGIVAYTLISPWPDADLSSLQPGTMTIVFHVTRLTGMR